MNPEIIAEIENYIISILEFEKTKFDFFKIIGNHTHRIKIHRETSPKFLSNSISFNSYYRLSDNAKYRAYRVVGAKFLSLKEFVDFSNILINRRL